MALEPLAKKGNFFHVYDFRVKPGSGERFIDLFNEFDYSDVNPMHKSSAQVKDGVLCRDVDDPDHFYLIGEWRDIDEHRRIRATVRRIFEHLVDERGDDLERATDYLAGMTDRFALSFAAELP